MPFGTSCIPRIQQKIVHVDPNLMGSSFFSMVRESTNLSVREKFFSWEVSKGPGCPIGPKICRSPSRHPVAFKSSSVLQMNLGTSGVGWVRFGLEWKLLKKKTHTHTLFFCRWYVMFKRQRCSLKGWTWFSFSWTCFLIFTIYIGFFWVRVWRFVALRSSFVGPSVMGKELSCRKWLLQHQKQHDRFLWRDTVPSLPQNGPKISGKSRFMPRNSGFSCFKTSPWFFQFLNCFPDILICIMCPFDLEWSYLHVQKSHEEYILDKAAELGVSWRQ